MAAAVDAGHVVLMERLKARRAELTRRAAHLEADRRRARGPLEADFEEQAVQRENDEVLDMLDDLEHNELRDIDAALRRIDSGCFGICDECGGDIDPLRLDATPTTGLCLACAKAREAAVDR